jgi:gliding motility-associated-like protein
LNVISFAETKISDPQIICQGEEVVLEVSDYPVSTVIQWLGEGITKPGLATQKITPESSSVYTVTLTKEMCSVALETSVTVFSRPEIINYISDDENAGEVQLIFRHGTPPYQFTLDDNMVSSDGLFDEVKMGYHRAKVNDVNNCMNYYDFYLEIILKPDKFFTPNGDVMNDTWQIKNIELVPSYVYIYDRFGRKIMEFDDNFTGWDGTLNGTLLPSTDYWYVLQNKVTKKITKGHFTLLR